MKKQQKLRYVVVQKRGANVRVVDARVFRSEARAKKAADVRERELSEKQFGYAVTSGRRTHHVQPITMHDL